MKTKVCTNKECGEHPIEEFTKIGGGPRRQSQCRKCLTKKAKLRPSYSKPKVRTVSKTDGVLANDYTSMKW